MCPEACTRKKEPVVEPVPRVLAALAVRGLELLVPVNILNQQVRERGVHLLGVADASGKNLYSKVTVPRSATYSFCTFCSVE